MGRPLPLAAALAAAMLLASTASGGEAEAPAPPPAPLGPGTEFKPLSLEALRHLPPAPAPRLDLRAPTASEAPAAAAAPGAAQRVKERIRLERRKDAIGPAGPRQGTRSETDAGLRVPLDESVSVEGGVRVDQRDEPGAEEPERKSTPRVGVEVRF